jgi:hypothetical protein
MNILANIKSISTMEFVLIVIFILFIILPMNIPTSLASSIDSPLGMIVLFGVTIFLFLNTHPILGILYILVAYEMLRRSSAITVRSAIIEYTPSQMKKDMELQAMNPPQPTTLEEEIIEVRAPVGKGPIVETVTTSFKPVADKLIEGASLI